MNWFRAFLVGLILAAPTTLAAQGFKFEPSLAAIYQPQSYDAFGDSITAGCCGTPNYVANIGSALGLVPTNHGVSGNQAIDGTSLIYGFTVSPTARQLITYQIGTNDASFWVNANPELSYAAIMAAQIGWLTIPEASKVRGQSSAVTYAGTWANNAAFGGAVGEQSTTNGSTATLSLYGSTIYLAYYVATGNGGTFTVTVDGTQYGGTYLSTGFNNSTVTSGVAGNTNGSFLLRIPNLSMAQHTVVMTVTSATGSGNVVGLDWAAGLPIASTAGGPTLLVGSPPRQYNASADANLRVFANLSKAAVATAAADGLNVQFVETSPYLVQSTDFTLPEVVHPNTIGHAHLAQPYISFLRGSRPSAQTMQLQQLSAVNAAIAAFQGQAFTGQIISGQGYGSYITNSGLGNGILSGGSGGYNNINNAGVNNVLSGGFYNQIANGGSGNTFGNFLGAGNYNGIQYGGLNFLGGGTQNAISGFQNAIAGGAYNTLSGANSMIPGGQQATDRGRAAVNCFAAGKLTTQGDSQGCQFVLSGVSSSTTATRLVSGSGGAANATNCINIPNNSAYAVSIDAVALDTTAPTTNYGRYRWSDVILVRGASASTTALSGATLSGSAVAGTIGTGAMALSADTTNGCLNLSWTAPNSNTTHVVARVRTAEVQ